MQLATHDLSIDLSGRSVLHGLNVGVETGEVVGLLGPNGAGKSTLLRAMAGLLDTANVEIDDRPIAALGANERARRIAFLPQVRTIGWSLSVEQLVLLGRIPWRPYGQQPSAQDREIVAEAMRLLDIEDLAARPSTELSGGEQARVLAARAIAQSTPFLLADEPAAGLDPAHQIAMMQAFRAIAAKGCGVLVSLHDLTLAARWCDRVVVLDRGRVAGDGRPDEILGEVLLRDVYGVSAHISQAGGRLVVAPLALERGGRR